MGDELGRNDYENLLGQYGENDYITQLFKVAHGQEVDKSSLEALSYFKPKNCVYSAEGSHMHPIMTEVWTEGSEYEDPYVYGYEYPPITLDKDLLYLVNKYRDVIKDTFPDFVSFVDRLLSNVDTINNYMKVMERTSVSGTQVVGALSIDPSDLVQVSDAEMWFDIIERSGSTFPEELSRFLGGHASFSKLREIWPSSIRERLGSELTAQEQVDLLMRVCNGLGIAVERGSGGIAVCFSSFDVESNPSQNTSDFTLRHAKAILSDSFLNKFTNEFVNLHDEERESILIALLSEEDRIKYFVEQGRLGVSVIEFYKGYASCSKTETRLVDELETDKALLLRLNFSTRKTSVLFGVKFQEVTLLAVLDSDDESFPEGMSYIPIGKAFRDITTIRDDEGLGYDAVDIPANMAPFILAKNRVLQLSRQQLDEIRSLALEKEQQYLVGSESNK